MDLNRNSDNTINQVFLLRRQRAFNSQSGHLNLLFALFVSSWLLSLAPLRALRFFVVAVFGSSSRSSFLRGCYLIGYFSTNRFAMTSRCNSFVPPPITSSGASR